MDEQRKKSKVVKIVNEMLSEKRKDSVPYIKTWNVIKPKVKNKINECIINESINEEDIIIVADETIMGTGKKGIVFTLTGFYCSESYNYQYENNPMEKVIFPVEYNKIEKCELNANQSYINVIFKDDTVKYLYAGIYGKFVQELINNILECMKPDANDYAEEAEKLARQYIEDDDVETIKKSYELYIKAIELGDVHSEFYAASIMICEYSKSTIEFDYDKCLGWLKDAVAAGYRKNKSLDYINKLYRMDYNEYLEMEEDDVQKSKYVEEKALFGNSIMMLIYGMEKQDTDKLEGIMYILTSFEQKFFNVKFDSTIRKSFADAIRSVERFKPTYEMIRDERYIKILSLLKQLLGDDEFYTCVKEDARESMRERIRKIYNRLSDTDALIENLYYNMPKETRKEFVMKGLNDDVPIFKLLIGSDYEDYGLTMESQINNISIIISEFSEEQIKKNCVEIFDMILGLNSFYTINIRYYETYTIWWKRLSKYRDEIDNYCGEFKKIVPYYQRLAQSVYYLVTVLLCEIGDEEKVSKKSIQDYFKELDATGYKKVPVIELMKVYGDEKGCIYKQMEIISEYLPRLIKEIESDEFEMIGGTILRWELEDIYQRYEKLLDTQFDPKYETAIKRASQEERYKECFKTLGGYDQFYKRCSESYKLEKACSRKTGDVKKYLYFFKSMEECYELLAEKEFLSRKTKEIIKLHLILLEMKESVISIETAFDPKRIWIDLDKFL